MNIIHTVFSLLECKYIIPGHDIFFHPGGSSLHKPKFWKGRGSIFPGEFSDIIAFLLPNIFEKPRIGGMSSWGWTFKKGSKAVL